ncbi:kinase-like domain-containing protein, partial [Pisolithus croceorrhizus]
LEDIASGLYYVHSHDLGPIVHGDLKGLNVLVSSDRRALLSDFGLSTPNTPTSSMSVDTPRGGSCRWIAPELLDDCPASTASDVWAFGMTTLELFTRTVPFPDCHGSGNVFGRFKKGKLPPRPTGESTQFRLTDALWNVCTSCWESGPSLRPKMKSILEEVKAISICTLLFPQVLCVLTAFSQSQTGPAVTPFENSTPARPISKEGERATRDHSESESLVLRACLTSKEGRSHSKPYHNLKMPRPN